MSKPSTNGQNGRDAKGRFAPGNVGGPGNPLAARVAKLRAELLSCVTLADMRAIIRKMVELAKAGDIQAAKLVFDRTLGACIEADLLERLESLEAEVGEV